MSWLLAVVCQVCVSIMTAPIDIESFPPKLEAFPHATEVYFFSPLTSVMTSESNSL